VENKILEVLDMVGEKVRICHIVSILMFFSCKLYQN
jgi:hypothetical protein